MKYKIPKRYWRIAKRLTIAELQESNTSDAFFSEKDLFEVNIARRSEGLFLGFYSKKGIQTAFERYGIIKQLKERGFNDLIFEIDTSDPYIHRLIIYDGKADSSRLLIEVVLRKKVIEIQMPFSNRLNGKMFESLAIEWLCMQNPNKSFSDEKPRLPGQKHPGLGMASKAVEILIITAWRLHLAGLLNTPDHFHNAYLYSRIFYYLNPENQARFMALCRDLKDYSPDMISWAVEWGVVIDEIQNRPMEWIIGEQIVPLHSDLKELFESADYQNWVKEKSRLFKFRLDIDKFKNMRAKLGGYNEA
ncbi:MAG: hypothetical protein GXO77_09765 [Calditrichaeota bacterium]|nr:hypothetical protein [Calditrichota bacterium]